MTSRKAIVAIVLTLAFNTVFSASRIIAQDEDLIVRVAIDPEKSGLVGQRVRVNIDVLARDVWANLPNHPRIDIPGAVIVEPPNSGVRLTEQIRGGTFIGQRYESWIYPLRQGKLEIPSLKLDVHLKPLGLGEETSKAASTKPLKLEIRYPKGVPPGVGVICTREFSAEQTWQPTADRFQVGDGMTRTISRKVAGVPAMALTPLNAREIDGIRVYPKQPNVDDAFDRGSLIGKRTDSVTFVFQKPGKVELPQIQFAWWDLEANELRSEELDGLKLEILPAAKPDDVFEKADTTAGGSFGIRDRWVAISIVAFGILLFWFRKPLLGWLSAIGNRVQASEAAYFRRFVAVSNSNKPNDTLRALTQWLDVAQSHDPAPRLDRFFDQYGESESQRQLASLVVAVDEETDNWNSQGFVPRVRAARGNWLRDRVHQAEADQSELPPLNPIHR